MTGYSTTPPSRPRRRLRAALLVLGAIATAACGGGGGAGAPNGGGGGTLPGAGLLYPDGIEPGDPSVSEAPPGKRAWYVDADAPEGGDGSYGAPFNSFEVVAGRVEGGSYYSGLISGGDYLYLKGTFRGSRHDPVARSMQVRLERGFQGGTAAQPTVIKSYRGTPRAVLDGEWLLDDLLVIRGSAATPFGGVRIENIEVTRQVRTGVTIDEFVVDAEVVGLLGHDGIGDGNSGISGAVMFMMRDSLHRFRLRNCLIHDDDVLPVGPRGSINNIGGVCVLAEPSALDGSTITISNNVIHHEHIAIRHKHSGNVTMEATGNVIHDVDIGFYLRSHVNDIHHNVLYDAGDAFVLESENQTGDEDARIHHNTVHGCVRMLATSVEPTSYARGAHLHDNLFANPLAGDGILTLGPYASSTYDLVDWTSDHNVFDFDLSTPRFLVHRGVPMPFGTAMPYLSDSTSTAGPVEFVDAANHDFRLTPTSRAVGAGTGGGDVGAIPLR